MVNICVDCRQEVKETHWCFECACGVAFVFEVIDVIGLHRSVRLENPVPQLGTPVVSPEPILQ
jgi:hypothetical protein